MAKGIKAANQQLGCGEIVLDSSVGPCHHRVLESGNDINQSKILYDPSPTVMEIKTKVNKWDLIKVKKLLHN